MSLASFHRDFEHALQQRNEQRMLRTLGRTAGPIDFSSNDYLGLARSRELHDAIQKKIVTMDYYYNGATGSRLLTGNHDYTVQLEAKLATIFEAESCLLFNSGYAANLAVISSLPKKGDTIIYDERAHACIKDGARLSLARRFSFKHNDLHDLENKMKRASGRIFVIVESIYSMDGDECPVHDLITLCRHYEAFPIIDEAHSTGVYGKNGSGLAVSYKEHHHFGARIYTFGKGMGIHGACVVGSKSLTDYLVNFARPFIYTTALSPHSVVSIECAFDYLAHHLPLQQLLQEKIKRFTTAFPESKSNSAIQTALFPGNARVKRAADHLQQKGLDVRPILSPTVPEGAERIRICLHTFNTDEELDLLINTLNELITLPA